MPGFVLTGDQLGPANSVFTWSMVGGGISDFAGYFPDGTLSFTSFSFNAEDIIRQAFHDWSAVANINFIEVPDTGQEFASLNQTFPDIRFAAGVIDPFLGA